MGPPKYGASQGSVAKASCGWLAGEVGSAIVGAAIATCVIGASMRDLEIHRAAEDRARPTGRLWSRESLGWDMRLSSRRTLLPL